MHLLPTKNLSSMAPKPWTTEPQLDLLKKYIPQFLAAQAAKKTVKLWPKLFGEWFTLFPEEDIVFQSRDPMEPLSNEQKKQLDVNMKARRSVSIFFWRWPTFEA
jgi:hypothetical protein